MEKSVHSTVNYYSQVCSYPTVFLPLIVNSSAKENCKPVPLISKHIKYTVLQKYRHTRKFLETKLFIKILKNPCYPFNVD